MPKRTHTSRAPKRQPIQKKFKLRHFWAEILLFALILVFAIEAIVIFSHKEEAIADPDYPIDAYLTASQVSLRAEPDPASELIAYMREGDRVLIWEMRQGVPVGDNSLWYYVAFGEFEGWVTSEYVTYQTDLPVYNDYDPNVVDFKADLRSKGFPEDYLDDLYALHVKYPSWEFTPLYTNYSFQTAVDGEMSIPGLNLVPATSPNGYKSREPHDYSYLTDSWHEYEYGWVAASREILAHQMDPRNFLNEKDIFQFENLQYNPAVQTVHGVYAILQDTFMAGANQFDYITENGYATSPVSYGEIFMQAASYANVNPYHLASRAKLEVSPTGSDSVSGDYRGIRGYYNFYNIGAYPTELDADSCYNGLITARDGIYGITAESYDAFMFPWNSPERSIMGGAYFLGRDYINADQQTLYLQKFNLVSRYFPPFQHQYMGNIFAPQLEAEGVYRAYSEIGVLSDAKEFLIPVFTDLPYYTPEPEYNGTPNNWLKSLRVNGSELPDFNYAKSSYRVELETGEDSVKIEAEPFEAAALVSGDGFFLLQEGENRFQISVTATDGTVRLYDLTIVSAPAQGPVELSSDIYGIDGLGYLYGADPRYGYNTSDAFVQHLHAPDEILYVTRDANGVETYGPLGTGATLEMWRDGELLATYTLVIYGDVNGDGSIDVLDARRIAQYNMGQVRLSDAQLIAMDANRDGSGDLLDAKTISNHVTKGTPIAQDPPADAQKGVIVE